MLLIRSIESLDHSVPSLTLDLDSLGEKKGMLFVPKGSFETFGSQVLSQGIPDKPFLQWVREKFAKPDKICLDFGAHIGEFALAVASGFSHTVCFGSFGSEELCCLYANLGLHQLYEKVSVQSFALYGAKLHSAPEWNKLELWTERSVGLGSVGLIKITVDHLNTQFFKTIFESDSEISKKLKEDLPPILFRVPGPDGPNGLRPFGSRNEALKSSVSKNTKEIFAYLESIEYAIIEVRGPKNMFLAISN